MLIKSGLNSQNTCKFVLAIYKPKFRNNFKLIPTSSDHLLVYLAYTLLPNLFG
jgi:hypothetical protein